MLCSYCGDQINPERLIAMPNTSFCVSCKSRIESDSKRDSKRERRKEPVPKLNRVGNLNSLYKCVKCGYALNRDPELKCAFCNEKTEYTIAR